MRIPASWTLPFVASLTLALAAAPRDLLGQPATRVQAPGADRIERRLQRISPRSGPPGTRVTVASGQMPHLTPARVAMGATRIGFEALAELLTSAGGEFEAVVTVPDWARWDRNHRFILFDFYFNPIAASDAFFVTDADGRLRREGRIGQEGACTTLTDVDGVVFSLVGGPEVSPGTTAGDGERRIVTARLAPETEQCGERPTLRVLEMQSAP